MLLFVSNKALKKYGAADSIQAVTDTVTDACLFLPPVANIIMLVKHQFAC